MLFWIGSLRTRRALVAVGGLLIVLIGFQLRTQNVYVAQSRNPVDLPHASGRGVLPAFDKLLASTREPVVSATENLTLLELQGAAAGAGPLYFLSRNVFGLPWREKTFPVPLQTGSTSIKFGIDPNAARVMRHGRCQIFFPTGTQLALNRSSLPEGSPDFEVIPCSKARNLLAYVASNRGQPPTLPLNRRAVSLWQLVGDPWFTGKSLSGAGRFALFRLLGVSSGSRLRLTLTTSPLAGTGISTRLPPAAVVGSSRDPLPLVGSGSARVFSGPLRPEVIDGAPYLVTDMGRKAELPLVRRPGVTGLWGKSLAIDPRFLTSYVRDISVIPASEYAHLHAPSTLRHFPADLGNPGLEYSGIYEDGWVGRDSYVYLSGGPRGHLSIDAEVLPTHPREKLRVLVNGKTAYSRNVDAGKLRLRLPLPPSRARRKIELLWSRDAKLLAPDSRRASALISEIAVR